MSPLDYAAVHNNVELVKLLLDYGATARRDNETFAVQRATILDKTTDAEVYTLIEERLNEEMAELKRKRDAAEELRRLEEEARLREYLREKHRREKEERLLALERRKVEKIRAEVRSPLPAWHVYSKGCSSLTSSLAASCSCAGPSGEDA